MCQNLNVKRLLVPILHTFILIISSHIGKGAFIQTFLLICCSLPASEKLLTAYKRFVSCLYYSSVFNHLVTRLNEI